MAHGTAAGGNSKPRRCRHDRPGRVWWEEQGFDAAWQLLGTGGSYQWRNIGASGPVNNRSVALFSSNRCNRIDTSRDSAQLYGQNPCFFVPKEGAGTLAQEIQSGESGRLIRLISLVFFLVYETCGRGRIGKAYFQFTGGNRLLPRGLVRAHAKRGQCAIHEAFIESDPGIQSNDAC